MKKLTAIMLVIALLLSLLSTLNMSIPGIVRAIRQRPRLEYDAPAKEQVDPAKVLVEFAKDRFV